MANELQPYADERGITDESQVLNLVNQRFEIAKTYRADFDTRFDKIYQYYRSYTKYDPEYWYRYQLFLPYIFSIIESITPDFVEALIGGDEFFNIRATGEDKPRADNNELLMKYQMNEKMEFYLKILMWIKSILIFGNGIVFTGWRKKTKTYNRKEWVADPFLGLNASVQVKRTEDIYNDPFIDTVFIKNFYPQPHKESVKECSWVIERCFKDWEFIQSLKNDDLEKKGVYKNLDLIKSTKPPADCKLVMEEMNNLIGISSAVAEDPINKPIEILKYWRGDRLIMVANRAVVIRDTENPFEHGEIPYDDAKDYPLDKEFFAIGDVDLLIPLQDICNDVTNLRLDNLTDLINTSYIVDRNANVNPDDVISGPSKIIWSDDKAGVVPVRKEPLNANAYAEPETMYKAMQRISGAWEYYQGATPQRSETATGIIKLQQAALRRFGYRIKLLQKTAFKNILTKIMQLNQQLLPLNYPIKVFDRDMEIKLNPWDIAGKFQIQVSGSANLVGIEERMFQLWKEAKNDPYFDQVELRKRMLDVMDLPNSEKLINQSEGLLGAMQGQMGAGAPGAPRIDIAGALKNLMPAGAPAGAIPPMGAK